MCVVMSLQDLLSVLSSQHFPLVLQWALCAIYESKCVCLDKGRKRTHIHKQKKMKPHKGNIDTTMITRCYMKDVTARSCVLWCHCKPSCPFCQVNIPPCAMYTIYYVCVCVCLGVCVCLIPSLGSIRRNVTSTQNHERRNVDTTNQITRSHVFYEVISHSLCSFIVRQKIWEWRHSTVTKSRYGNSRRNVLNKQQYTKTSQREQWYEKGHLTSSRMISQHSHALCRVNIPPLHSKGCAICDSLGIRVCVRAWLILMMFTERGK